VCVLLQEAYLRFNLASIQEETPDIHSSALNLYAFTGHAIPFGLSSCSKAK